MSAKPVQCAILEVPGHHPAAGALLVSDQIESEILDEKLCIIAHALLIERVDDRVTRPVGGGAGAHRRVALAVVLHLAAERALIDPPVLGARKRHAKMLELDDRGDRVATHVFDRVLVAEPVRAFDRVVHVPTPIVLVHISERGADPALRRHGVATGREDFADASSLEPLDRRSQGRPQTRAAGADDDDVIAVIGDLVGRGHRGTPNQLVVPSAIVSRAKMPATAKAKQSRRMAMTRPSLASSVWT